MKIIKAKFNSKCAASGQPIPKGVNCWYDPVKKKVYAMDSKPDEEEPEERYYRGYATYLERDSDHGQDY